MVSYFVGRASPVVMMDAEARLLPLKSVALLPLTLSFSGLQTKILSPPLSS